MPSHRHAGRIARLGSLALALAIAAPAFVPATASAIAVPIAVDDAYVIQENGTITISAASLLSNDLYGTSVTFGAKYGPGTWVTQGSTSISYTPRAGFNGDAVANYRAVNAAGSSAQAQISITVTGANDAPVITMNGQRITVRKGSTKQVQPITALTIFDAEAWGNDLRLTIDPAIGTVSLPSDPSGIAYLEGDGDHDGKLVLLGELEALSGAIADVRYHATAGVLNDLTHLTVILDDLGCCGSGPTSPTYAHIGIDLLRDETTAPVVTAPKTQIKVGTSVPDDELPVTVKWTQSDASEIVSSEIQRETDSDADWTGFTKPGNPAPTSIASGVWLGHTFRWRVRATDRWGNRSSFVYGPTTRARLIQQGSSAITYRGTWKKTTSSVFNGGSARFAKAAGASATFTFTGRSVAWVSRMASNRGKAKVYIDGSYVKTVDLYRASAAGPRIVFAKNWSGSGKHTVKIVVLGTSGRPRVDLDAFTVLN